MIQRYVIHNTSATVTVDGQKLGPATAVGWCTDEDVTELEDKYSELEAKYAKLGDYCWQLYHEVADLTNPHIEREPEELKEQAKDTLRNFEKDPLFGEIIA